MRVITYSEVVAKARRHFERHATIDMEGLAAEIAVSRATLYRVVPSRDRLLGDVLWSLGEPILDNVRRTIGPRDVDSVLKISRIFYQAIVAAPAFRSFINDDPQTAVRVLCTPAGAVHERYVRAQRAILDEASQYGSLRVHSDPDSLAYLYIRIYESMLYADILIGRPPDVEPAEHAARALLLAG